MTDLVQELRRNASLDRGTGCNFCGPAADEIERLRAVVDRLSTAARAVVMGTTPFSSALEIDHSADGEELHRELREALGISLDEWRDRP